MRLCRAGAPLSALLALILAAACTRAGGSTDSAAPRPAATTESAPRGTTPAGSDRVADAAATTSTTTLADTAALDSRIALGLATYRKQYCGICHQLDAANTRGVFGPTHNGVGVTAERRIHDPNYTGHAATAAEYIRESIVEPSVYIVPGYEFTRHRMPAYTELGDAELDGLVQLLLHQR